jgi:hypothetical protein
MTSSKTPDNAVPEEVKIEFAPGCFDNFDGTQEELDSLVEEITRMVQSGEAQEKSRPLDLDDLSEEEIEILTRAYEKEITPRKLQ